MNQVNNPGVKLEEMFRYRLTQECLSIFNANGTFRKVQKSKLTQSFIFHDFSWPNSYIGLINMGMICPTLKQG